MVYVVGHVSGLMRKGTKSGRFSCVGKNVGSRGIEV